MLVLMGKKGQKSLKGQAENNWGEPKSVRLNLQITETAKRLLQEEAAKYGISLAELAEFLARKVQPSVTIAQLIARVNLKRLAAETQISIERLQQLMDGQKPTDDELIDLAAVLVKADDTPWTTHELMEICDRTFPCKERQRNGH